MDAIVDAFLREQYPDGRDSQHDCWKTRYGEGDEAMAYCMRLLPTASVTEGGRHVIYIALASAADISGSEDYRYAAVDPGMFDAFRVGLAPGGRPKLTASSKGMDFGAAGDCGCADADFIPLGPDVHGWAFSSGVTQQGETSSTHSLIAPVGGSFRDVAGITQYAEGDADTEYRLAIGNDHPTAGWFPLTVSKYRNGQKLASRVVEFDPAAGRYRNPGTF